MKTSVKVALIILVVLILDQWLKVHIKLNFEYGQEHMMLGQEWAKLKFVENPGMAFGMELGGSYGKIILSVFRLIMVTGLIWYMRELIRHNVSKGFIYCIALITAGALGNIIDSAVYGLIFTNSDFHGGLAIFDPENGYAPFLHGRVVDMFYFPIKNIYLPDWIPFIGGDSYLFFSPIFNVADAAITTGLLSILLFQSRFFSENPIPENDESEELRIESTEDIDSGTTVEISEDTGTANEEDVS